MKFKFPKTVTIANIKFKMIYDKKHGGAEFSFPGKEAAYIKIGMSTFDTNPNDFLDYVIHEVKEILHVAQGTRYSKLDDLAYEFHYGHREHSDLCSRLADVLNNFIK